MAELTIKEKAARYDALQVAIKLNIENLQRRKKDAQSQYDKNLIFNTVGIISAYNKGIADTCEDMITTLTAFTRT